MTKLDFSLEFQNSIIKLILKDETFAIKCFDHLTPDLFQGKDSNGRGSDFLPWAFNRIKNYYETYKLIPTITVLKDQLKTLNEEMRPEYGKSFKEMVITELTDIQYMKDEMSKFIKNREFIKLFNESHKLFIEQKKYDETYLLVSKGIEKINNIRFDKDDYVTSEEASDILNRTKEEDMKGTIPTGYSIMDKELKGGMRKGTVTTIMAGYNVGKTISAINIASNAAKAGKKVLFMFHEGHKDNIVKQFIACLTGLRIRTIEYGSYVENPINLAKVNEALALLDTHIRIKQYANLDEMYVENVINYARIASKEMDGLDLLVDDYAGILLSKHLKYKEKRMNLGRVWQVLGLGAKTLDIVIVTIAQFNRDGVIKNKEGNQIMRSVNVGEAIDIAQHSDYIITLNKSFEDESNSKMILCLDKNKEGPVGKLVECITDLEAATSWSDKLGVYDKGYDTGNPRKGRKSSDEEE